MFHRPIVRVGANQSNNWSGYNQGTLEKGGVQFHRVSSTWVVPTATAHTAGEAEYSASWVGIGGGCVDANCTLTDATLIQAGTSQDVDASGAGQYSAWWEIIPEPSTPIANFAVSAGNVVFVDIAETTPGVWSIIVQNQTTGQTFSTTTPYTSTYATAEWIEETPVVIDSSGKVTVGPMPRLSTVGFDLSMTNGHSAGLTAAEEIRLVDSTANVLASPSAPDSDADAFNVCTFATACAAPPSS
jgi:peptidase A4-like protein